ncbi:restriction modification system DNA specificity domain-containing protein [Psychroflexus gondwanensis ACAM 44]|uniref:Restriction modification system DNA specificity domain-containing protein n=1 Tax=Psychroflexus gondwanensis ACAM 44 TaxID=1189619 RepID=N1WW06_9FLAO|nr:restriction endonuclease subunit S [Psychroflexus gondwanensis]EMY80013.1 restriction modification system DNA specificity domain-containing protein [Psychroflexus gondwanensis ACAM 44]
MSKLKPYEKYQPVQYDYVAVIPEGWQLLPNIAVFKERIERGFVDEELLSVTIGRGVIRQTDVAIKKDSSNEDKSKYKLIKIGDIAYNRMRMWQGALGYSDYRGITSPAYVILKPKIKINQRFFHYMFRTGFYTNYSKRFSYGIVDDQLSLRYVDFKRMYSILPPLETQDTIVKYLDCKTKKIQQLIQKKERLIDTLVENVNYVVNDDRNWKIEKAKWLFDEVKIKNQVNEELLAVTQDRGVIPKRLCEENFVSPNSYEGLKLVEVDDFVISLRSFQGGIEFSEYRGIVSPAYNIIRLKYKFNNLIYRRFFRYYFKSPKLILLLNTVISGIRDGQNINWNDFKNLVLPIPSEEEIRPMLKDFDKLEKLKLTYKVERKKIQEYQNALITPLVTGEIRVPTEKVMN